MKCNHCKSEVADGANFCPYCGKPIGVPESWKCPLCNMNVREGTKYCPNCGSPIGAPSNNDFKNYAQNAFDRVKKVDWNEKKEGAFSFIKEFITNPEKISLATKVVAVLFALWFLIKFGLSASIIWYLLVIALLYIAFLGIPKLKIQNPLKTQYFSTGVCAALIFLSAFGSSSDSFDFSFGESPEEAFQQSILSPSTAYVVKEYRAYVNGREKEVSEDLGDESCSYEWNLIFFPSEGRATLEAWRFNHYSWTKPQAFDYEIKDNHIELYNGYYTDRGTYVGQDVDMDSYRYSIKKADDIRLIIEKVDDNIQLRGQFRGEERVFKKQIYPEENYKEKHLHIKK